MLGKHDGSTAASSSSSADKPNAKQKQHETETVKALLSMSAVDTPLLMLAFAAGNNVGMAACWNYVFHVALLSACHLLPHSMVYPNTQAHAYILCDWHVPMV